MTAVSHSGCFVKLLLLTSLLLYLILPVHAMIIKQQYDEPCYSHEDCFTPMVCQEGQCGCPHGYVGPNDQGSCSKAAMVVLKTYGETCADKRECEKTMSCENKTCVCPSYYTVSSDKETCLKAPMQFLLSHGESCAVTRECDPPMVCQGGTCNCPAGHSLSTNDFTCSKDAEEVNGDGTILQEPMATTVAPERHIQLNADFFVEGAILKASCPAIDGQPHDWVKWFIGDQLIEDGRCDVDETTVDDTDSHWDLCLNVTRHHDKKQLTCVAKSNGEKSILDRRITVTYAELTLNDDSYNAGDKMTATCVVTNSHKSTQVSWLSNDDVIKKPLKSPTTTTRKVFKVSRILTKEDNGNILTCTAEIDGSKPVAKSSQLLHVKYPPDSVQLTLNSVKGYTEGDLMTASCLVKSNPPGNVSCHLGEDVLPLEEETVEDGTVVARFKKELTKEDDEKVLRCVAEYNHIPVSSEKRIFVGIRSQEMSSYLGWLIGAVGLVVAALIVIAIIYKYGSTVLSWLSRHEDNSPGQDLHPGSQAALLSSKGDVTRRQ